MEFGIFTAFNVRQGLVYGIGRSSFVDGYRGYGIDFEESRSPFWIGTRWIFPNCAICWTSTRKRGAFAVHAPTK